MNNDLLDAVDALTLPTHTLVAQWIQTEGRERHVNTRVEHEPLLYQLEAAIASTLSSGGPGAKTAASESNVLDSAALYRFSIIDSTIRDWCRMANVRPDRHPVENLRAWYAASLALNLDERVVRFHIDVLRGWAAEIRSKMNPRRQRDLPDPCPECNATEWKDSEGNAGLRPLLYTWQPDHPRVLETAIVRCRACDMEWRGLTAVRAVAFDLEQRQNTQPADPEPRVLNRVVLDSVTTKGAIAFHESGEQEQ